MKPDVSKIRELRQMITDEIAKAFGFSPRGLVRQFINPIFWPATQRFASLMATFDTYFKERGLREATRWFLRRFVSDIQVSGAENIPDRGPLLIVSNHPGTVDGVLIAANLPRDDLKVVVSGIPFFRNLDNVQPHLIHTTHDTHDRMGVARAAIRQLKQDGALLIFPSGHIDPDPEVIPGAMEELDTWSPSIELFTRFVPQTQVLVTIVSGVLASNYVRHPLTLLRQHRRDRQRIAEFMQVIRQILLPKGAILKPKISFAPPLTLEAIRNNVGSGELLQGMIQNAKSLLHEHTQSIVPRFQKGFVK
jgi:hypothetical protein